MVSIIKSIWQCSNTGQKYDIGAIAIIFVICFIVIVLPVTYHFMIYR